MSNSQLAINGGVKAAEGMPARFHFGKEEKAAADAAELARSTENKKAAMRARAESRMDGAAALIVERIVNG